MLKTTSLFISLQLIFIISFGQKSDELKILADEIYSRKDGMALTMDVYIPDSSNGAGIIFINSGGFRSPDFSRQCKNEEGKLWDTGVENWLFRPKNEMLPDLLQSVSFEALLQNGYTVFDVRHGSSPKYMLDKIISDLHIAISYIKNHSVKYSIFSNRLGIWGGSAGGYLAAYFASNPNVGNELNAAVLFYPAGYNFLADRNEILRKNLPSLNVSDQKLDSLSLKNYISEKMPPTLILYGKLEQPFISKPSEAIYKDLKKHKVPCEKIVYENVGHVWQDNNRKYNPEIGDSAMQELILWFDKYLFPEKCSN